MKKTSILSVEESSNFRLNRLACQHPLCFRPGHVPERFAVNRSRKGVRITRGGRDSIGFIYTDEGNKRAYTVGMLLQHADEFIERGESPLPGEYDYKILMGLLSIAIKKKTLIIDFKSTYAILKALDMGTSEKDYDRLWNTFDKLSKTSIVYQKSINIFSKKGTGKRTTTIGSIICVDTSYWDDDKEAGVHIQFTERFMELLSIQFSAIGSYAELSKLKGTTALNLYTYLKGLSGFFINGKTITRNLQKLCIEKLGVCSKTKNTKMRFYLSRALCNINKINNEGIYSVKYSDGNVEFKYIKGD